MKPIERIIYKERLDYLRCEREFEREDVLGESKPIIGTSGVRELREYLGLYDERLFIWYAGLYDPTVGGFYYSNSGRDTELFAPDLESTRQALTFMGNSGLVGKNERLTSISALPEVLREKIISYTLSLQAEDGFFYHPQWGKKITASRRGRDFDWGKVILSDAGAEPRYPYPFNRGSEEKGTTLPDYLRSAAAFRRELEKFDLTKSSYSTGNWINAQTTLIKYAGEDVIKVLGDWLVENLRSDNGLWEKEVNYSSVNGLMKISAACRGLGIFLPYMDKSLDSAIQAALSDEEVTFCCEFYNPWCAIGSVTQMVQRSGNYDLIYNLRQRLWSAAPELIKKTREKVEKCRLEDGTFSYYTTRCCPRSQGAAVATEEKREGDVNAAGICSASTLSMLCSALGLPTMPMFTKKDGELFVELLMNAPKIEKLYKCPYGDELPHAKDIIKG